MIYFTGFSTDRHRKNLFSGGAGLNRPEMRGLVQRFNFLFQRTGHHEKTVSAQ
jgi:hypothetical protein